MQDIEDEIYSVYESDPNPQTGYASAYKQLRPVERAFVDAYLSDMQQSAVAAGQKVVDFLNGSTRDSRNKKAHWHANQMMMKPMIRAAISERITELTRAMEIDAFVVLKEVANIARSSIGNYMTVNPLGMPEFNLATATPEQLAAVQSVEVEYDADGAPKKFKFKLHDKLSALDKLMRYMNMFEAENKMPPGGVIPTEPRLVPQIASTATTAQAADIYARTLRRGVS